MAAGEGGGVQSDVRDESGHVEVGEVRLERMEGTEMGRLREVNVDELHDYVVDRTHAGQLVNISCRTIRSQSNDPEWMDD